MLLVLVESCGIPLCVNLHDSIHGRTMACQLVGPKHQSSGERETRASSPNATWLSKHCHVFVSVCHAGSELQLPLKLTSLLMSTLSLHVSTCVY